MQYAIAWLPQLLSQPFGMNFEGSWFERIALQPPLARNIARHLSPQVLFPPEERDYKGSHAFPSNIYKG